MTVNGVGWIVFLPCEGRLVLLGEHVAFLWTPFWCWHNKPFDIMTNEKHFTMKTLSLINESFTVLGYKKRFDALFTFMWGVGRAADLFLSRPDEVVEKAVCPLPSQPGEAVGEQAAGEVQTHGAEEEGFEGET